VSRLIPGPSILGKFERLASWILPAKVFRFGDRDMTSEGHDQPPVGDFDIFAQKVAAALLAQMKPPVPLSVDLWDTAMIGAYQKRNPRSVSERVVVVADFPRAIRIPSNGSTRPQPLWRATEVIAWAESYMDRPHTGR
jgi:hypothetical protein